MAETITCLVAEDDLDDQEIFSLAVEKLGSSIVCSFARNGLEALDELNKGTPDYIFLDLNMPMLNGLQCLERIKRMPQYYNLPVVVYSTSSDRKFIEKTFQLGGAAFIKKPTHVEDLTKALSNFFTASPDHFMMLV
jgi:CheY-like chemotaxis protein